MHLIERECRQDEVRLFELGNSERQSCPLEIRIHGTDAIVARGRL